jgi:hypothetical protein
MVSCSIRATPGLRRTTALSTGLLAGAALLFLLASGNASAKSRRDLPVGDFEPIWTTPAAAPAPVGVEPGAGGSADSAAGGGRFERISSTMDRVFGPGRWRQTSGYRSPAQEDELRREGAGTVAPGRLSHHSLGTTDAPGAYDVVVAGMSAQTAAVALKRSGAGFSRILAEGVHGGQGPHLHLEPGVAHAGPTPAQSEADDVIYLRVVDGERNRRLSR